MLTNKTAYAQRARLSLIFLWVGAFTLLSIMLYNWHEGADIFDSKTIFLQPKHIFVDQLLLSSEELQLGEGTTLINISLNKANDSETKAEIKQGEKTLKTQDDRKLIYSKILKTKIKKITSVAQKKDVIIKPLPQ